MYGQDGSHRAVSSRNGFSGIAGEPADWLPVPRLLSVCQSDPLGIAYRFDCQSGAREITREQLWRASSNFEVCIRDLVAPGERVLLAFPPGLEFVLAFWACLRAGVVAVPAPSADARSKAASRLAGIITDACPALCLTTPALVSALQGEAHGLPCLGVELESVLRKEANGSVEGRDLPPIDAQQFAFLQYTSGSTSLPRGVKVSHGNLAANVRAIVDAFELDEHSRGVIWLPHFHDMGLIGGIVVPALSGFPVTLFPPAEFVRHPSRWLELISRYEATVSGGPNFGYDWCVDRIPERQRSGFRLQQWKVAFTGAEPIRARTLSRFEHAFKPSGFSAQSFVACYGLAEATLLVSSAKPGKGPTKRSFDARELRRGAAVPHDVDDGQELVSSGYAGRDTTIAIVDPESRKVLPTFRIGEVWVSGPSVAHGYWSVEDTVEFDARTAAGVGGHLRTGDLGFVDDNQALYVCGRRKDVIIVRGVNHYAEDFEATAACCVAELRGAAAFGIESEHGERVVIAVELGSGTSERRAELAGEIAVRVAEIHEVAGSVVCCVRPGSLPRTASGKVRRSACRRAYISGQLEVLEQTGLSLDAGAPEGALETWLRDRVAELCNCEPSLIDRRTPMASYGLDSVGSIELLSALEEHTGKDLWTLGFAGRWSIADLASRASAVASDVGPLLRSSTTAELDAEVELPATQTQQGMLALEARFPQSRAYYLARAFVVRPRLTPSQVRAAVDGLVRQRASLRARIVQRDEPTRIRITAASAASVDVTVADLSSVPRHELPDRLRERANRPLELDRGPLVRAELLKLSEDEDVLLLVAHHLILDLVSLQTLADELLATLREAKPLVGSPNEELRSFTRFHEARSGHGDVDWWRNYVSTPAPALSLPATSSGVLRPVYAAASLVTRFDAELFGKVRTYCRVRAVTPFSVLLAAFSTVLARRSAQEEASFGVFSAARRGRGTRGVVGYFSNLLFLQLALAKESTFDALVGAASSALEAAVAHDDAPFASVLEAIRPRLASPRDPALRVVFGYQQGKPSETEFDAAMALGLSAAAVPVHGGQVGLLELPVTHTEFELVLQFCPSEGTLLCRADFACDRHERSEVLAVFRQVEQLLQAVLAGPEVPLGRVTFAGGGERADIQSMCSIVLARTERSRSLAELVDRAREGNSAQLAVRGPDRSFSYDELLGASTAIAGALRRAGVARGDVVAIRTDPSGAMIAALLGVLRVGAAFLPIPTEIPHARMQQMLQVAKASFALADDQFSPSFVGCCVPVLRIGEACAATSPEVPENGAAAPRAEDVAYVMFTSGSTGAPKAVAVQHGNVVSFLAAMRDLLPVSASSRFLSLQTIAFDISVLEIFLPLTLGASVIVAPAEARIDPSKLLQLLRAEQPTVVQATPTVWKSLLASGWRQGRDVLALSGGETLPADVAEHLLATGAELWNVYGPTEATVWSSASPVRGAPERISIGRPLANSTLYLLDDLGRPAARGTVGEIYVGGDGVALGYLGAERLTAERFLPDPFLGGGRRMYRTGDLARCSEDGRYQFLNRNDRQLKIRGHRVEPAEVEAALRQLPGILDAAVAARLGQQEEPSLVAYLVYTSGLNLSEVRAALRRTLPPYMLPSEVVSVDAIPRTPSGKVDARALGCMRSTPDSEHAPAAADANLQHDPLWAALAMVWQSLLNRAVRRADDDFFELGGHSLALMRLANRVREQFGVELRVPELWNNARFEQMVELLRRSRADASVAPRLAISRRGATVAPLTPAQRRLWVAHQLDSSGWRYVIPLVLRLHGALARESVDAALAAIVSRHETLRTAFVCDDSGVQAVLGAAAPELAFFDLSSEAADSDQDATVARALEPIVGEPFDLQRGPLMRAALIRLEPEVHLLGIGLHHIVFDGASLALLCGELIELLRALRVGQRPRLPALEVQYGDYAQSLADAGACDADSRTHWERVAERAALPTFPRARAAEAEGPLRVSLPAHSSTAVRRRAARLGCTATTAVLSTFAAAVALASGTDDLVVAVDVAQRNDRALEPLLGLFVEQFLVPFHFEPRSSLISVVEQGRDSLLEGLRYGVAYPALAGIDPATREALFSIKVSEINAPLGALTVDEKLTVHPIVVNFSAPRHILTLFVLTGGEQLELLLDCDGTRCAPAVASRILRKVETMLRRFGEDDESASVSSDIGPIGPDASTD
jgi:amino acid adenylation domain-containing protein